MTETKNTADEEGRKWLEATERARVWWASEAANRSDSIRDEVIDRGVARYFREKKNHLEAYLSRELRSVLRKSENKVSNKDDDEATARPKSTPPGSGAGFDGQTEAKAELSRLQEPPTLNINIDDSLLQSLREVAPASLEPARLQTDLNMLADSYRLASERRPDDDRARMLRDILTAISYPRYDLAELAGKARYWLDRNNGPFGSRTQQKASLLNAMVRAQLTEDRAVAAVMVWRRLLTLPDIADMVPIVRAGRLSAEGQGAFARVQHALEGTDPTTPETLARKVLRALDAPESKVKALFDSKRKAKVRKKKVADK